MDNNIIEKQSFEFALRIVKLYKFISSRKNEFILSKQLLRSGTSIGANVVEAQEAQSRADFCSKMNIALKESAETLYWLKLIYASGYLSEEGYTSIYEDAVSLKRVLVKIVKTTKDSIN